MQKIRKRATQLSEKAAVCYIASGLLVMIAFVTYFIPVGKICGITAVASLYSFLRGQMFDRIAKDILFDLES